MDPKLPKPARLTISRATNGRDGDRIRIEIRTEDGGRVLAEITPGGFGLAVTGRSEVDCVITGGKL